MSLGFTIKVKVYVGFRARVQGNREATPTTENHLKLISASWPVAVPLAEPSA